MKSEVRLIPENRSIVVLLVPESIGEEMLLQKLDCRDTMWNMESGKLETILDMSR